MLYRRWLATLLLLLLSPSVQAQFAGRTTTSTGNIHIYVVFDNDRHAGSNLLVRLMQGSTGIPVASSFTNDIGQAQFSGVLVGNYHVLVSGDGIQDAESGVFELDNRKTTQTQYVTVHRVEASASNAMRSNGATVSAMELNVPEKARKEFDKANQDMARQDWKGALERLNKAVAIYPQYAAAYNNLGVLYSRLEDYVHEQEALEKAISLNDHFAPALENMGKLCLRQKKIPQAETLLEKAVSADPGNTSSLTLLAEAQYMNHHFDAAIASARQVHAVLHHPSFVHYIAARAWQQEGQQTEVLAEFKTFLQEEPSGPRADYVRADMAKIENSQH